MKAVNVEAVGPFEPTRFRAVADPLTGKDEPHIAVLTGQSKIIFTTHV